MFLVCFVSLLLLFKLKINYEVLSLIFQRLYHASCCGILFNIDKWEMRELFQNGDLFNFLSHEIKRARTIDYYVRATLLITISTSELTELLDQFYEPFTYWVYKKMCKKRKTRQRTSPRSIEGVQKWNLGVQIRTCVKQVKLHHENQ